MKNNSTGYTIIELLLAVGLATFVIGGTISFLYYFFSEKQNLDGWSSTQIEMSFAIKNLENDLRNVARLEPTEDLFVSQDGKYFGLSSIAPGAEPKDCMNDDTHSVFRYTTLDRFLRSERLLRSWSELSDSDNTASMNELRVTADSTTDSLFSNTRKPAEVTVVDADRRYIRRFEVASTRMNLNSTLDPYDGQPKKDVNGNQLLYNYASVLLKTPKNAKNITTKKTPSVFITGSEVYSSTTYFICLRHTDLNLVKIDPLQKTTSILLQSNPREFNIQSFVAKYLGTKKGIRVDPVNFFSDMIAVPEGTCVNSVYIELKAILTLKNSTGAGTSNKMVKNIVSRGRTIFATNLNSKRSLSCIQ